MFSAYTSDKIKNLKRYLGLRIIFLLSVFMLLLMATYNLSSIIISTSTTNSALLNIAGQQRMFIYQYASETSQALVGLSSLDLEMAISKKKKADLTAKQFEMVLDAFEHGGEVISNIEDGGIRFISALEDKAALDHLEYARTEWNELKRISLLGLRSDIYSISKSPYVQQLLEQANKAVIEMNHVVQIIQSNNDKKLNKLDTLLMGMMIVGLILFLITIYFVYFRIITPLDSSVQSLSQTLENLQVEKNRAEDANQYKSEFLSHMSHELRTPLNAILGFGQLLELDNDNYNETQKSNIQEILSAGQHLLYLINEILDLSKIESGKMELLIEDVDICNLMEECTGLISPQVKEHQIELMNHVSSTDCKVRADSTRLKQILLNLLSNAVKYNGEHGCISLNNEIIDRRRMRISVTDTGKGLSEEEIYKLFTPFERLNATNNVEGTGIGLVIAKHMVELMGGIIGVESTLGEGSTFWVELEISSDI